MSRFYSSNSNLDLKAENTFPPVPNYLKICISQHVLENKCNSKIIISGNYFYKYVECAALCLSGHLCFPFNRMYEVA